MKKEDNEIVRRWFRSKKLFGAFNALTFLYVLEHNKSCAEKSYTVFLIPPRDFPIISNQFAHPSSASVLFLSTFSRAHTYYYLFKLCEKLLPPRSPRSSHKNVIVVLASSEWTKKNNFLKSRIEDGVLIICVSTNEFYKIVIVFTNQIIPDFSGLSTFFLIITIYHFKIN